MGDLDSKLDPILGMIRAGGEDWLYDETNYARAKKLIHQYILEIIGETEVAWKKPKVATRNELRREQRAKLRGGEK